MSRDNDTDRMQVMVQKMWEEYKSCRTKPNVDDFISLLKLTIFVSLGVTRVVCHERLHRTEYGQYASFGLIEDGMLKYTCFYHKETDSWGCKNF